MLRYTDKTMQWYHCTTLLIRNWYNNKNIHFNS